MPGGPGIKSVATVRGRCANNGGVTLSPGAIARGRDLALMIACHEFYRRRFGRSRPNLLRRPPASLGSRLRNPGINECGFGPGSRCGRARENPVASRALPRAICPRSTRPLYQPARSSRVSTFPDGQRTSRRSTCLTAPEAEVNSSGRSRRDSFPLRRWCVRSRLARARRGRSAGRRWRRDWLLGPGA